MGSYTKNIAVIRQLKSGFSADGGELTGLVKAERYGAKLKAEASLINFAPLSEGRYVTAISDGKSVQILDGCNFEGATDVDTSKGFAALVCFVNNEISPIASAVCGNFQSAALGIRAEIEKAERQTVVYRDEALAEENYYEYEQTHADGGSVCENKEKEKIGDKFNENEAAYSAVQSGEKLARAMCFYERMKEEIDGLFSSYPEEENLNSVVENSRWVKISYGDGKFYVFGIIYGGDIPQYICYGVPSENGETPPESLKGLASFIPAPSDSGKGYWVMYQDAATGASVKISIY